MPANALDYITIKGFRSIASIEKLKLGPVNVVIGPNGSGKSNFIGAFSFLHAVREGRLQDYVTAAGGAEKVLHFGSKTTKEVSFRLSFKDRLVEYALSLSPTGGDSLFPSRETARNNGHSPQSSYDERVSPWHQRLEAGLSNPEIDEPSARWVRNRLGSWRL